MSEKIREDQEVFTYSALNFKSYSTSPPADWVQNTDQMELNLADFRRQSLEEPLSMQQMIEMAQLLHRLDTLLPDGGSRVPEAVALYK